MWNPEHPMNAILAAAKVGQGELPSEDELRARLDVVNQSMWQNGRSVQSKDEYFAICEALDKFATTGAT
jgi:hypothetical protein